MCSNLCEDEADVKSPQSAPPDGWEACGCVGSGAKSEKSENSALEADAGGWVGWVWCIRRWDNGDAEPLVPGGGASLGAAPPGGGGKAPVAPPAEKG